MTRPDLDDLITEAAKLPPGPEAWVPIFKHYPELSIDALIAKFRQSAERAQREAEELEHFLNNR
jgi:hypothetical protein